MDIWSALLLVILSCCILVCVTIVGNFLDDVWRAAKIYLKEHREEE